VEVRPGPGVSLLTRQNREQVERVDEHPRTGIDLEIVRKAARLMGSEVTLALAGRGQHPDPRTAGRPAGGQTAMTEMNGAALRVVAERLGSLVARSRIRADGQDLGVTVSIGGTMAIPGDTAATIFKRADATLCRAKDGGRNRAELDPA
jgi:GGDEF domain-containing protein